MDGVIASYLTAHQSSLLRLPSICKRVGSSVQQRYLQYAVLSAANPQSHMYGFLTIIDNQQLQFESVRK